MGRPASIIVANMRVKMTTSVTLTPVPNEMLSCRGCFFTSSGESICICSFSWTASSLSASMTPFLTSPLRARASQTYAMAMFVSPLRLRRRAAGLERRLSARPRGDDLLQLVGVRAVADGLLQRDEAAQVQRRQRLI